ncbi:FkbM family methyltransferase [Tardiphaga sp. 538_B7_N1_4]|uniref:FkbM family methyltransferase n=1 Tax=Tardiphaga sp. 538_B7_N1_4 TaxID=3240778 RepID=UPI003F1ED6A4
MIAFCLVSSDHGPMIVNRFDYNHTFSGDFYGVGAQILENGCYDPRDVNALKDLLRCRRNHFGNGVVALDIGANIGVHSVEWAKLMRGWGSVVSVEAQERVFYALAGNLTLQNCFNARAIWAAIGEVEGELDIPEPDYTQQASFGSFELKPRVGGEFIGQAIDYGKPTSRVRQTTIDSLGLERLDLLKLDIEGMESEGLNGAVETIARCKPILFVETIKSDKVAISSFLGEMSYRVLPNGMNILAVHKDDPTLANIGVVKEAA